MSEKDSRLVLIERWVRCGAMPLSLARAQHCLWLLAIAVKEHVLVARLFKGM